MDAIAIVTLHDTNNFGNRLQNFALQEALKRLGCGDVTSLRGLPRSEGTALTLMRRLDALRSDPAGFVGRAAYHKQRTPDHRRPVAAERSAAIEAFSDSHIPSVDFASEMRTGKALAGRFRRFVVGSDQVWNPAFTHGNMEWFLDFAPAEKRVAYAASFGIPEVPRYLVSRYRRGIAGIPHLSVREQQGATVVEQLGGRTPPVVLDPTLLLDGATWTKQSDTPPELEGKDYALTFRLKAGDSTVQSTVQPDSVIRHAQRSGLEVVDLFAPADPALLGISPFGFIGAIRNARLVITDSFHAAVFSLLFHTPFLLEQRGAMNSRIETLMLASGLHNRMLHEVDDLETALEIDWADVDARLARRRRESLEFLEAALTDGTSP